MALENIITANLPLAALILMALFFSWLAAWVISAGKVRMLKQQLHEKDKELDHYRRRTSKQQDTITTQKVQAAKLATLIKNERKHAIEKITLLEEAREELRLQFRSLAQQIFEEKSESFSNLNQERLSAILHPLREQIDSFKKRIDDIHLDETRERVSLKTEIHHLRELNQHINKEAINLTRALKGDRKLQGNWGELVLERILEQSGLRKGHEYDTQGGFRNREDRLLKPDVILHLPDEKEIIIDSKVSLSAWERHVSCEQEGEKTVFLQEHIRAIRAHIDSLSKKDYTDLKGIRSLDFVLMFMPIEAAYAAAFQEDETLFSDAFAKKIIVVTPTTLLATMRTIENIWRYEHQSRNAKEIAERAGAMYNKLRSFVEDMEKIGKQLASCTMTYDTAMNKLCRGKGNLIFQANKFTDLGVKVKKTLPRSVTELSESEIRN